MKCANFTVDGIYLKTKDNNFNLHDHFSFRSYQHEIHEQVFTLFFTGNYHCFVRGVEYEDTTDLKIVFKKVHFLRVRNNPLDPSNICFEHMKYIRDLRDTELLDEAQKLFLEHEFPDTWQECIHILFVWGVDILISAATVEVEFNRILTPIT